MIATILGICPIMRLDDKGRIIAYGKVRGKAAAVKTTVDTMERFAQTAQNMPKVLHLPLAVSGGRRKNTRRR